MKTNFHIKKNNSEESITKELDDEISNKDFSKEEFEEFILKSGAKGSFMIYRSEKKEDELGLEEL